MCDDFRDGIFNLHTRQFGKVAELIVEIIYDYSQSKTLSYDLQDSDRNIEVKASRVLKSGQIKFSQSNLYEKIIKNSNRYRLIRQEEVERNSFDFDCNIQQIKPACFHILHYILFFADTIELFKIDSSDIADDKMIQYSDKQHRGNVGEGQFHINNKTYSHHKKFYFQKGYTYKSIVNIIKNKTLS